MPDDFDLVVVGTGVAGNAVAHKCSRHGWKVAVVDDRPFGGTCSLRGCNPKKVLTSAAELVDRVHRMKGRGITQGSSIDWRELMAFKRTFTEDFPTQRENDYRQAGIRMYHGRVSFEDPHTLGNGDQLIRGRKIVLAPGASPAKLGIPGEDFMATSDEFLELDSLPSRILFVGGGYISFEFGQVAALAGAEVTIVHRGARPLRRFERGMVETVMGTSREIGLRILLERPVTSIRKDDRGFIASTESGDLEADLVVHGAGRVPNIESLLLENGDIDYDRHGIIVDRFLRSVSNPDVYAAGDAAATRGMQLSPVADLEAFVIGNNLVRGDHQTVDYTGIPTVVFTSPPMASVGSTEEECRAANHRYRVKEEDTSSTNNSRRVGVRYSAYKVLVEEGTRKILGAHMVGHHAEDVINIFGMAMRYGLTADQIKSMPFSFPTGVHEVRYMV